MEYKYIELLRLDCGDVSDDEIRTNITYRYGSLLSRHQYLKTKLKDISEIIKLKNPSLLLQIQKLNSLRKNTKPSFK